MRWPGSQRKWMSRLACTLWHCQLFVHQGSIIVGVKWDDEDVVATDHLVWCVAFCAKCPAFASQCKQKKPSSAPPMCHTLQMSHAADTQQTSNGWFTQDKIQSNETQLSICYLMHTPQHWQHPMWATEALTERRKVSLVLFPVCTANWGSWNASLLH